jgi:hypothetical protein
MMIILFSCEEKGFITDCDDCTQDEPLTTILKAEIDEDNTKGVKIMVWEGRLEDNLLLDSLKILTASYQRKVNVNQTYTFTATYTVNNKKYTAVDSATPRVRYTTDYCEEPCYYVYDLTLNLRLKYTK